MYCTVCTYQLNLHLSSSHLPPSHSPPLSPSSSPSPPSCSSPPLPKCYTSFQCCLRKYSLSLSIISPPGLTMVYRNMPHPSLHSIVELNKNTLHQYQYWYTAGITNNLSIMISTFIVFVVAFNYLCDGI